MTQKLPSTKQILIHFDAKDPVMAAVIRKAGVFKLSRNHNYFLVLCKAIIAQQISTKAAESITRRFQALFAAQSPTPEEVVRISKLKLRNVGLSGQKVKYLKDLGARFLDGSIRPHRLTYQNNEEVIETLTSVYGIGRWTVEMFLIFCLMRPDIFPVADIGLQRSIANHYNHGKRMSEKQIENLACSWKPWRTVATWYLWRALDPVPVCY